LTGFWKNEGGSGNQNQPRRRVKNCAKFEYIAEKVETQVGRETEDLGV